MRLFKKTKDTQSTNRARSMQGTDGARKNVYTFSGTQERRAVAYDQSKRVPSASHKNPKNTYLLKTRSVRWLMLSFLLVLLTAGTFISVNDPKIKIITASSYAKPISVYEETVETALKKDITSRSKLLLNSEKVVEELRLKHPEIAEASLRTSILWSSPRVEIRLDEPVVKVIHITGEYLINERGKVIYFDKNKVPNTLDIPIVYDKSNTADVTLGSYIMTTSDVTFVKNLYYEAEQTSTPIQSIEFPVTSNELWVRFKGSEPIFTKFFTEGDVQVQFGAYKAIIMQLSEQGIAIKEYVDVRVEGRVFYK